MQQTKWLDRKFHTVDDNGLLPSIIERLIGTSARIEEKTKGIEDNLLKLKIDGKLSVKEEIGHLSDLEPLGLGRIHDFENNLPELRAADMSNQKTNTANHNSTEIKELVNHFRKQRQKFVNKLKTLNDEQCQKKSLHPRLKINMKIVDLAHFICEHDDHHLARMTAILSNFKIMK